jgi:peptide/nickel transport system substrate-binding protein
MSCAVLGFLLSVLVLGVPERGLAEPGSLRVGLPALPPSLDPASALEGPVPLVARQVFDTLLRYTDGGSDVEPALAVQWSVSRDGLVWTFRLREGVRFHDGTPLTSQHVVDSLERLIRPGHPNAPAVNAAAPRLLRGVPGVVKEIRVPDARTVQIALVQPYAPLLAVLAHPALSIVLPSPPGEGKAPFQGTGPFAIAEMTPERIVLEARPGHWAGGPRVGRLVFTTAPDASQAAAALDAQALDLFFPAGAPPRQSGAVSVPGWRIGYLALQTEKEPFSRGKVRRAVATAIDPASISLAVGAAALPLRSFVPTSVWGRRDGPMILEGSPERAKKLLAESGLRRSTPPTLLVADGDIRADMVRAAEAIRASLAAADFAVAVQPESIETAQTLLRAGEHVLALVEERAEAGDPHFLLYPLSTAEGAVKGPRASNFSFYRNPRLDDLLIRASQLSFKPERQKLYVRAQAMLAEDLPWIPIYVRLHWAVARPEVRNLRLHASGNHRLDRVTLEAPAAASAPSR